MTNSNEADVRWRGITRPYSSTDVERVRGSLRIEHTLARRGAEKLWQLLQNEDYVAALGALTGNQAMQQVKAGLKAIYVSGWQVAADANLALTARRSNLPRRGQRRYRLVRAHSSRWRGRFRWTA